MRLISIFLLTANIFFATHMIYAQNSLSLAAEKYTSIGDKFYKEQAVDSSNIYYQKAADIYKKIAIKNSDTLKWANYLKLKYYIAWNLISISDFDKSVEILNEALKISLKYLTENSSQTAQIYNGLGRAYYRKNEFETALKYYSKSFNIIKKIYGEENRRTAVVYNNLANVYLSMNELNSALDYYFKSARINKKVSGEKSVKLATAYNNIGTVYRKIGEYDLALEYFFKSLQINKEKLGETSVNVAVNYHNIANAYMLSKNYDKSFEYYLKSLEIRERQSEGKNLHTAADYLGFGNICLLKKDYKRALKYQNKALKIRLELLGENHTYTASSYNNIGTVYAEKGEPDSALVYLLKSLKIRKKFLGEKHTQLAETYNNIGNVYRNKKNFEKALQYYQKAAAASLRNFNDTSDIFDIPVINDYLSWEELLKSLQFKAEIFADSRYNLSSFNMSEKERLQFALLNYQACDTLISQVRKNMAKKTDKLALGEKASDIYKKALDLAINLSKQNTLQPMMQQQIRAYAFYFSEKNKSSVLLDALAGAEALKFAGIPDTLLKQEQTLQNKINYYKNILADGTDSIREAEITDKLFKVNRTYDSLIIHFEKKYPEYYDLKYNQKPASVRQISRIIDRKSAMISYQIGDSLITIFVIKHNEFFVTQVPKPESIDSEINKLRFNISNITLIQEEIKHSTNKTVNNYQKSAFEFYNLLFPKELEIFLGKRIKNLIIIPDGKLATLPFEVFHTDKYNKEWAGWNNTEYFSEMPYLLKKYSISYNYSANLFYKSFHKKKKQDKINISELNDWLAFAPVFDNDNISGTALRTRKLLNKINPENSDTVITRTFLKEGKYIYPLPGSLKETKSIFKLFDEKNKSALLKTHLQANEEFAKSGELSRYKYLHFATHGIVDEEKPELSGLILAQDTASTEDNILFSGEIYNIKLNADLTVLSACETGLGKITKGEGIIGLTRALLYAGSKNIIVSLWQVSDNSTNKLMVDFYTDFLNQKKLKKYGKHLRNAKIKMINEGKYAHPFFWSPFILIGR